MVDILTETGNFTGNVGMKQLCHKKGVDKNKNSNYFRYTRKFRSFKGNFERYKKEKYR